MENKVIKERLTLLRAAMKKRGIDFYMIPTSDFHNSEYVDEYFKVRRFFCNFSGSNGTLLVWREGAGLWTDGRYFIQAEKELEGTGVDLFRMLEEGVPTIEEFLKSNMEAGQTLGFDGRVVSAADGKKYEKILGEKQIVFAFGEDLAEGIWIKRPDLSAEEITVVSAEIAGKSVEEKVAQTLAEVKKEGADSLLLTKLDDVMWLFNIRGSDVEGSLVALSYGFVSEEDSLLFVQEEALTEEVRAYLKSHRIQIMPYDGIVDFLKTIPADRRVLADNRYCSYTLYKTLCETCGVVERKNPTELLKAIKNPVELANMERIYLQDSVAVTKFICWLKARVRKGKLETTELSSSDYLERLRMAIPGFIDLSFHTIAAYKENAAMMHYEASKYSNARLKPEGMYLIDSGGQYEGGTTDVTRTVVLGPVSEEIKKQYTMVAAGMLQLSAAKWLHGCTGRNLDILARQPLWDMGLDYKCGTGHGVGYMLNVHEGPQSLRWRFTEGMAEAVIEEGMNLTNEPGVYVKGSHGIRIENVMVAKNDIRNEYGQFMRFDTLTWVPIDPEGINESYMTETQRELYHKYQWEVYERISPHLEEEERIWLKKETGYPE